MIASKRLLVFVCSLLFFLGYEAGGFQQVLLAMASEFDLSSATMGNLLSIQFAGMVAMPILFGRLADSWGKQIVTGISCLVLVAGCTLVVVGQGFWWLAIGVFLIGTGYSVCEGTSMAALADAYPDRALSYFNSSQAFFSVGAIISPLTVDFLMRGLDASWRIVFIILGLSCVVLCLTLLGVPYRDFPPVAGKISACGTIPQSRGKLRDSWVPALGLLGAMFICCGLENGVGYYLNVLLDRVGYGVWGAFSLSAFWLAMVSSRVVFSVVKIYPRRLAMACFFVAALAIGAMVAATSVWICFVSCVVIGFGLGPIWPTLMALSATRFPSHSATVTSFMVVTGGLGSAFFSFAGGHLAQYTSIQTSFVAMAAMALGGIGFCGAGIAKNRNTE